MSNINLIGAKNLRKIRRDLGLKQRELECENAQNISQLETGVKAITEDISAPALFQRITQIMKERGLTLPYEVTIDLLLGTTNIITNDLLKRLKAARIVSLKMVQEIDDTLKDLSKEDSISFLNDTILILGENDCANAELIMKYSLKFLKLDSDLKAYKWLINAYSWLNKHEDVVNIAKIIEEDIDRCKDKEIKYSCYRNIARALYYEEKDDECLYYLKKLKLLGKDSEFFYLTLESAIFRRRGNNERAEKVYLKILDKAILKNENDYIVDSISNLSGLYEEMGLIEKAREYANKAISSIRVSTERTFIFNAYYNAFEVYIKHFSNEIEEIEQFLCKALPLAIEMNLTQWVDKLFEKSFNMYFEKGEYNKISNILKQVNTINIKSEILEKLIGKIGQSL